MTTAKNIAERTVANGAEGPRRMLDVLMGRQRVTLLETQRAILLVKGRLERILGPGQHTLPLSDATVERHDLARPELVSVYERTLFNTRRELAERHLVEFVTGPEEVGVILRDGRIYALQKPEGRSVLWKDAGPFEIERVALPADLMIPTELARRLERFGASDKTLRFAVEAEQAGLLYVDGAFVRRLEPGAHMFWNVGRRVQVKIVDLRVQPIEVHGQEILTRDRVSLRVNLAAEYRVIDPERAVAATPDYAAALYRAVQFAFRKTLGALTLDELLAQKISVDAEAAAEVRAQMALIGLEVGEIALKDVVLPGEMRTILNQVVTAEKQAEANVIRRREETAATRSLLNTARIMTENPVMLRLKELEALEAIAEKVDQLVIHNGAKGLLQDVARLTDET